LATGYWLLEIAELLYVECKLKIKFRNPW